MPVADLITKRIARSTRRQPRRAAAWTALLVALLPLHAARAGLATVDAGAQYPEGPLWVEGTFHYVEYSRGNVIARDGTLRTVLWHGDGCGPSGLAAFDGTLLVACYDGNYLLQIDRHGRELHRWRRDARGAPFAGPNDFAPDGRGGVYFSASGVYDTRAPVTGAVYHLGANDLAPRRLADTIHYPNGLALSGDGRQLLVAEMLAGRVLAFDVEADGSLGARRVWARLQDLAAPTPGADAYNGPDGLKLGADGCYYIAQNGSGRVLVVDQDRRLVRTIDVPAPYVTNIALNPGEPGVVYVTGVFDEWHAPYAGAVYRWQAE